QRLLGEANAKLEKHEAAVRAYRKALQLDAKYVQGRIELGKLYEILHQDEDAADAYGGAIELQKENVPMHAALARVLLRLSKTQEAVEVLTRGVDIEPDEPELVFHLGVA